MGTRPSQGPNLLPSLTSLSLLMTDALLTYTPSTGRTSIIPNRPENVLYSYSFPTQPRFVTFYITTVTFLTPKWPVSSDLHLSAKPLSHAFPISLFHSFTTDLFLKTSLQLDILARYGTFPGAVSLSFDIDHIVKASLAERLCSGLLGAGKEQLILGYKVWVFSLWGFTVYQYTSSQPCCCLYLNVLFHSCMNIGTQSGRREKAFKTDMQPPHWLR